MAHTFGKHNIIRQAAIDEQQLPSSLDFVTGQHTIFMQELQAELESQKAPVKSPAAPPKQVKQNKSVYKEFLVVGVTDEDAREAIFA